MPFRYIPHLRSKAGEVTALQKLGPVAASRMLPLVHIVTKPPAAFAKAMAGAWAGKPMALDGGYNYDVKNSIADFSAMYKTLGDGGVGVFPSLSVGAPAKYVASIQPHVGKYAAGLLVKTSLNDLGSAAGWVQAQSWKTSDVDLVLDLKHIGGYGPGMLAPVVTQQLAKNVAKGQWRSVTLASAAAPKDFTNLAAGRNDVARLDWQLWSAVRGTVPFALDYGDYGVGHPDLDEPPGVAMVSATVSVRYTTKDNWIAIKGKPQSGKKGQPMHPQYLGHAKLLTKDVQFGGVNPCWGDDSINQISNGKLSPGSRAKWVEYSVNRHLSLVARDLP